MIGVPYSTDPWNEIVPGLFVGGHDYKDGLAVRTAKPRDEFDIVITLYQTACCLTTGCGPVRALMEIQGDLRPDDMSLTHGDGDGLDQLVDGIARGWGWRVEPHPARWEECGAGCPPRPHRKVRRGREHCPVAGPRRNREMCAAGADVLLAFPGPGSTGTWDCVHAACRYGIPSRIYPLATASAGGPDDA